MDYHIVKRNLLIILLIILSPNCLVFGVDVDLNGYTFSDDSAELYKNPFFSNYDRIVDFSFQGYGYGDFQGYDFSQVFSQNYSYQNIKCIIILERGYIPEYTSNNENTSLYMNPYTRYLYYAKDSDDNIHILNSGAENTLIYPSNPTQGQDVFGGYVEDIDISIGETTGCFTIMRNSFPYDPSIPIKEYISPGWGIFAFSYNLNNGINGYSTDGEAPEFIDEEEDAWDEWLDEHCFISSCSR